MDHSTIKSPLPLSFLHLVVNYSREMGNVRFASHGPNLNHTSQFTLTYRHHSRPFAQLRRLVVHVKRHFRASSRRLCNWNRAFCRPVWRVNFDNELGLVLREIGELHRMRLGGPQPRVVMRGRLGCGWQGGQVQIVLVRAQIRAGEDESTRHCARLEWQVLKCT